MSQHAIINPGLILNETNQESTMNEDTHKTEMSSEELAAVTGGGPIDKMIVATVMAASKKEPEEKGGKNDPAQMFQQIMQQLTQQ